MRWLVALIACASVAHADPDKAKRLFDEGRALAKAGRYAEACDRFQQSYANDPETGTEVNLADCTEKQGKLDEAYRMFDHAAIESLRAGNTSRAKFARDRADAIAKKLPAKPTPNPDPNPNPNPNPNPLPNPNPPPPPDPAPNPDDAATSPSPIPSPAAAAAQTPPATAIVALAPSSPHDVAIHRSHVALGCAIGFALASIATGYWASLTWHDAANRHDVAAANTALNYADIGTTLGIVSVASFGIAGYLYFTAPDPSSAAVNVAGRF